MGMSLHGGAEVQCSLCEKFASGATIRHQQVLDLVRDKANCPYYQLHLELNRRLCEESGDWWKTSLSWTRHADSSFYNVEIPAGLGYSDWCDVFTETGELHPLHQYQRCNRSSPDGVKHVSAVPYFHYVDHIVLILHFNRYTTTSMLTRRAGRWQIKRQQRVVVLCLELSSFVQRAAFEVPHSTQCLAPATSFEDREWRDHTHRQQGIAGRHEICSAELLLGHGRISLYYCH